MKDTFWFGILFLDSSYALPPDVDLPEVDLLDLCVPNIILFRAEWRIISCPLEAKFDSFLNALSLNWPIMSFSSELSLFWAFLYSLN